MYILHSRWEWNYRKVVYLFVMLNKRKQKLLVDSFPELGRLIQLSLVPMCFDYYLLDGKLIEISFDLINGYSNNLSAFTSV